MMHAYDKLYLDKARTALARMLDFAVYDLHYDIREFFELFLASGIARRFEQGDFTILAGMSVVEPCLYGFRERGTGAGAH